MPYDANLVLRGQYGGVYVDLEDGDTSATTLAGTTAVNGNHVVDLGPHGTGAKGLDIVIIFHDTFGTYQDYLDCQICTSDHIAGGWELALEFPRLYPFTRELIIRTTDAFTAADDIDAYAEDLIATAAADAGHIIAFSRELLVVGGVGKIWVAMQDLNDLYATPGDTLTTTQGHVATQIGASRQIQTNGFTMVRRLSTPRRYIRFTGVATQVDNANFGDVDVLATNSQHNHVNNLYR